MKKLFTDFAQKIKGSTKSYILPIIVINLFLAFIAVLRDILLASYLGTTAQADALLLALFIPDTLGNNILNAAILAACVPVFSKLFIQGYKERLMISSTFTMIIFFLLSVMIFLVCQFFNDSIINGFGEGFSLEIRQLCFNLFNILLPIIMAFPYISIGSALLQVHSLFSISALAPVVFNLIFLSGIIVAIILKMPSGNGVYIIAISVVIAIAGMSILIWSRLLKNKTEAFSLHAFSSEGYSNTFTDIIQIMRIFLPYLIILLSAQSVLLVERYLASRLEVGTIAGLNYAYRMSQFPIWVFVAAVGMVILPAMSKSRELGNLEGLKDTFSQSLRMVLILCLPISSTLFILRVPVVSILLQRGAFDNNSLKITAGILAGYSLSIVGQGLVYIMLRVFLAMEQIWLPLIICFVSAAFNIGLDYYLVGRIGWVVLGYGAAAGFTLNAALMIIFLRRKLGLRLLKQHENIDRILLANLPIILIAILCSKLWSIVSADSGIILQASYVVFVVSLILASYFVCLRHLKII